MWNKTVPVTGSYIVDIPSIYTGNWTEIENISAIEHYGLTVTLSGRHQPGIMGIMESASTTAITAITAPSTGAMAQDTTLGVSKIFTGATWEQINLLNHSEVIAYRNADYLITTGTTGLIPFDTESNDKLNEYDNATYIFIAKAAGFYFVRIHANFTTIGGVTISTLVEHYNASDILQASPVTYRTTLSTDEIQHGITLVLLLAIGDKLQAKVTHSHSSSIVLNGGSDRNFLNIYRIC